MERFLAELVSKTHKKTAGVAGGFWEIRTLFLGTFQNSLPPTALENQK
jgi:hypothetical protein